MNNMMQPDERGERIAPANAGKILRRMLKYLADSRPLLIGMLVLLSASTALNLLIPDLIGRAVDTLDISKGQLGVDWQGLIIILSVLLTVFVFSSLFSYIQGRLAAKLSKTAVISIRKDVSEKLIRLPVSFFDSHKSGDMLARLTNDIDNISNLISQAIGTAISSAIVITGCIVIMLIKSPLLTAVCLSTVFLNILFTVVLSKKMFGYFRKQQKAVGEMNSHVEQSIDAKKTVNSYNITDECVAECDRLSDDLMDAGIKAQVLGGAMSPVMCIIGNLNFLLIVAVGALLYINGGFGITIGTIQAFTLYSRQFTKPINELSQIFAMLMTALASAERVFEIIDAQTETDEGRNREFKNDACSISFEHVSFCYIRGIPVLDDFNLKIESGQTVALVGKTGVGKTTLINLLMRFYEPDSGRILIDGVDIRDIPKATLRKTVTTVLQNTTVIDGTVTDNLSYGNLNADAEEITKAAKMTGADDFIKKLSKGYDTDISPNDPSLSRGQQQLLCLACASLTNPRALVLDEALSSVDSATETQIQNAMLKMMSNRTCIIIAHRLSTIKNADKIAVFSEGTIAETGTHDQLMNMHGVYYELYKNQYIGKL